MFGPKAGDNEDLRGLLNAGHQRGRPAIRYDASTRRVERIDTFAMAALAGIGTMPDTIEDRAVVIRMRRRAPHEYVAPYRIAAMVQPSTTSGSASTAGPEPTSTTSPPPSPRCRSRTAPPTPGNR